MKLRRTAAFLVVAGLVASCGGGGSGDSSERTRNAALEVDSTALPFAATNLWAWDIKWSEEAQRAVSFTGDSTYEGLFVGGASVVKTSDPNDESVPAAFPVATYGVKTGVPDGKGGWYVGGGTVVIDGNARGKMAHILADGTVDNAFYLNLTADMRYGYDASEVHWMAMHPNGTDVVVTISGVTSVSGEEVSSSCAAVYVLDGTTGMRKKDLEPREPVGCSYQPVLVGNRLITQPAGGTDGVPLLVSIDLTTGLSDGFVDPLNARFPYFKTSDWDYRYLAEMEVRGNTLWVFGNLDRQHHRVAKFDLSTGQVVDFAAPAVEATQWSAWQFDYAATDTHVMVHVRDNDENGRFVSVFHVFDAASGRKVPFSPDITRGAWDWNVNEVSVWRNNFLLSGNLFSVNGRKVRGHVVLDAAGNTAASQLPYTLGSTSEVRTIDFAIDRTLVVFPWTTGMYDAYFTGRVLVTDTNGVPQVFRFDDDTESRDIGGVGVVGKWLYVSSLSPWVENEPLWTDSRVDRFDLTTGKRDEGFRVDTDGSYVYDIYGNDEHVAFILSENRPDGTQPSTVSLRSARDGAETARVPLLVEGEQMTPGEATVSDGMMYVRVVSQQGIEPPVAARIDMATGDVVYVTGARSAEFGWNRPTLTSKGLMLPMQGSILVIDPTTMAVTKSIDVAGASDVVEAGGRLVVNTSEGTGSVELDTDTLDVKGAWGPAKSFWSRIVAAGDGFIAGTASPMKIAPNTVASGLVGLKADGSPVALAEYRRIGSRPKADSPDVVQTVSPQVLTLPGAPEQPVPQVPGPNATTQRGSERVSIVDVAPGDRSVTVTYRGGSDGGKHTVRVVGGRQSCSSSSGSCTVKGLTAGTAYRFVVVPESADAQASAESVAVSPWVALKKGATKKATALLKVPAKGTAKWTVKGAACVLKGTNVTGRKKGRCSLTVSVKTKSGTIRSSVDVRVQ